MNGLINFFVVEIVCIIEIYSIVLISKRFWIYMRVNVMELNMILERVYVVGVLFYIWIIKFSDVVVLWYLIKGCIIVYMVI